MVIFSLTATPRDLKKVLMRQGWKPAAWPTRGGLRWSKLGEYKEERPHYERGIGEFGGKTL